MAGETRPKAHEARAIIERVRCLRLGARVHRCHQFPYNGAYSVADHSHGMLTLLYALWPLGEPPMRLVKAVHFHDIAEGFTGDIPVVTKWANASLREGCAQLECRVNHALGLEFLTQLGDEEQEWLDALDKLELWLWCCEQGNQGNRHVDGVMRALENWFEENHETIPDEVYAFYEYYEWAVPSTTHLLKGGTL